LRYRPIVTTSAAKQIAEHLRSAILDGEIKGEERLPTESELAARYGVSRPTVREALKRLAAQNLISSRRGPTGGTFVNSLRLEDLAENIASSATMLVSLGGVRMDDIAQARIELEGLCCRLAAKNATEEVVAALGEVLKRQRDSQISDEEFCALDVRFHRIIVDAAGNTMLRFVMYALVEALVPITNMVIVFVRDRSVIVRHHERMAKALAARDARKMCNELQRLVEYLEDRYAAAQKAREKRTARSG
jgi:GntR family transcriptional repressor for pyruvate dehydrogenase complex